MFVIFGTGHKHKVETRGQFVCPKCSIKTEYTAKSSSQYLTLFFIPIFPVGEKSEPFVECQTCKRTYCTDVLKNNDYNLDGSPFKKDDYDIEIEPQNNETYTIKNCPNCQQKIGMQKGNVGVITCPSCQRKIYTSTK
ncbi:zinc-ribbon domain-containing protein [Nitrospinota bacterium]